MSLLFRRQLLVPRSIKVGHCCWSLAHVVLRSHTRSTSTFSSTHAPPPTPPPTPAKIPLRHGGPYSPAEDKLIQERRAQGVTFPAIAAELGVTSVGSVMGRFYYVEKHENAKSRDSARRSQRSPPVPWDTAEKEALISLYNAGRSVADIMRETNRTRSSVRTMIDRIRTLPGSTMQRRICQPRALSHEERVQIMAWRKEKVPWREIGIRLDRNPNSLAQIFHEGLFREVISSSRFKTYSIWSSADDAELWELQQSGLSNREVGMRLGRSVAAVKKRFRRLKRSASIIAGSEKWPTTDSL